MDAKQLLVDGDLTGSLGRLQEQVRQDPADPKLRVFLFQLLAVLGQWDRALTQLNVSAEMDPGNLAMAQAYREALRCEMVRKKVFRGETSPMIFGDPEEWIAHLVDALRLAASGNFSASQDQRDRAFEAAPATSGSLGSGSPGAGSAGESRFEWLADADLRLGPVMEALVNGNYYWIPLHRIHRVNIEAPEDLRDLVWLPAQFTWANGGQAVGLIPTRYPGSEESEDSSIRLARRTEWIEKEAGFCQGLGQRMLTTDDSEFPLLDVRTIELDTLTSGEAGETDEAVDG